MKLFRRMHQAQDFQKIVDCVAFISIYPEEASVCSSCFWISILLGAVVNDLIFSIVAKYTKRRRT